MRLRLAANSRSIRTFEKRARNPFGMRSFKTQDLKLFRMCSFRKTGDEGVLLLTRNFRLVGSWLGRGGAVHAEVPNVHVDPVRQDFGQDVLSGRERRAQREPVYVRRDFPTLDRNFLDVLRELLTKQAAYGLKPALVALHYSVHQGQFRPPLALPLCSQQGGVVLRVGGRFAQVELRQLASEPDRRFGSREFNVVFAGNHWYGRQRLENVFLVSSHLRTSLLDLLYGLALQRKHTFAIGQEDSWRHSQTGIHIHGGFGFRRRLLDPDLF